MSDPSVPPPQEDVGSVSWGVAIVTAMHILMVTTVFLVERYQSLAFQRINVFSGIMLVYWGVAQLVYVVPAYLYQRSKGHRETAKGIAIAAGIGFLLNGACFAAFSASQILH